MRLLTSSVESTWEWGAFGGAEAAAAGMVILLGLVVFLCIFAAIPIACSHCSDHGRSQQQSGGAGARAAAAESAGRCAVDDLQLSSRAVGYPAQAIKAVAVPSGVRTVPHTELLAATKCVCACARVYAAAGNSLCPQCLR